MKGIKYILATLIALVCFQTASADDIWKDITAKYLQNPDFEGSYSAYKTWYEGDATNERCIYAPEGWTVEYTNGDGNDITCLNSGDKMWSMFSSKAQYEGVGSNTYWIRMRWGTGANLKITQSVNLPEGSYRLEADYYKSGSGGNSYIVAGDAKATSTANEDKWKTLDLDFDSDGKTATALGFLAQHTAAYEKYFGFDNFRLSMDLTQTLKNLIAKANALVSDDDQSYEAIGIRDAINEANAVLEDTEASEDGYMEVIEKLQELVGGKDTPVEPVDSGKIADDEYKTELKVLVGKANLMSAYLDQSIVSASQKVLNNSSATKDDIDEQTAALKKYFSSLKTVSVRNADFDENPSFLKDGSVNVSSEDSIYTDDNYKMFTFRVPGWNYPESQSWTFYGSAEYGSSASLINSTVPEKDIYGNSEGAALFSAAAWTGNVTSTQNVGTLNPGRYVMYYEAYNANSTSSIANNYFGLADTYSTLMSYEATTWIQDAVVINLADTVYDAVLSLGYKAVNSGSGSVAKLYIDNVVIYDFGYDPTEDLATLQTLLTKANALVSREISADALSQLQTAIFAANSVIRKGQTADKSEILATRIELQKAVEAATESVNDNIFSKATIDSPMDVTYLIENAECSSNDYWDGFGRSLGTGGHWSGDASRNYQTCNYNGGNRSQTVVLPRAGLYLLKSSVRFTTSGSTATIMINDESSISDGPVQQSGGTIATDGSEWNSIKEGVAAGKTFANNGAGYGWTYNKLYYRSENNNDTVSIRTAVSMTTSQLGGMQLYYLGAASDANSIETAADGTRTLHGIFTPKELTEVVSANTPAVDVRDAKMSTGANVVTVGRNPNALIIANDGQVMNDCNVAVDGKVKQLILFDGYGFSTPNGNITADDIMYHRTIDGTWGNLILPFDTESNDDVILYTLGDVKQIGDYTFMELTEVKSLAAGTPAIYSANGDARSFTLTSKGDVSTDITDIVKDNVTMTGTFTSTKVTAYSSKPVFVFQDDVYVKTTESFNSEPFRVFLRTPYSFSRKIDEIHLTLNAEEDYDVVGIDGVTLSSTLGEGAEIESVYTTGGQRIDSIRRGINIIHLTDGTTKKILVR